jgi:hypothetical protein
MTRRSRSALLTVAAVIAVLGGLVVAGRWSQGRLDRDGEPGPPPTRPPATTTVPPTGAVARVGGTGPVDDVAVGQGAVWTATGATVTRFDATTGRATASLAASTTSPPPLLGLTAGPGAVWVATMGEQLLRVEPDTAKVVARLPVAPSAPVAVGAGGVWVARYDSDRRRRLARVDPATNRVVAFVELPGIGNAVAAGPGGVWVRGAGGPVWRVDPAANRVVAAVPVPGMGERPGSIAVTPEAVWVSYPDNAAVVRIDPRRNRLTGGRVPADGEDLAVAADGVVWATRGTRLLGLGRAQVLGPHRDLHELSSVHIVALAAGPDGLWLGTPAGLFRVDPDALD